MLVLEDQLVCGNAGCAQRFNVSWDGICDDCTTVAQDHAAGLHDEPMIGAATASE